MYRKNIRHSRGLGLTRKEVEALFEKKNRDSGGYGGGKEFTKEIKRELGVLSEGSKGWSKRVRVISWNGGEDKLDIRSWNGDQSGKGISLSSEESYKLFHILESVFGNKK